MSSDGAKQAGAVRKRQQISNSSKQMFMWVAGMSAVIGAALVVSWFVWQQISAKQRLVKAKNETIDVLVANRSAVPELRKNIRALDTNTGLMESRASEDHRALQSILDALPAVYNPLALGASIEHNLAVGINGLRVVSLMPTGSFNAVEVEEEGELAGPVADESAADPDVDGAEGVESSTAGAGEAQPVGFTMTVEADNIDALIDLLERFEASIRVIDIDDLKFEKSGEVFSMTINAHGYYQEAKVVQMTQKKVEQ